MCYVHTNDIQFDTSHLIVLFQVNGMFPFYISKAVVRFTERKTRHRLVVNMRPVIVRLRPHVSPACSSTLRVVARTCSSFCLYTNTKWDQLMFLHRLPTVDNLHTVPYLLMTPQDALEHCLFHSIYSLETFIASFNLTYVKHLQLTPLSLPKLMHQQILGVTLFPIYPYFLHPQFRVKDGCSPYMTSSITCFYSLQLDFCKFSTLWLWLTN